MDRWILDLWLGSIGWIGLSEKLGLWGPLDLKSTVRVDRLDRTERNARAIQTTGLIWAEGLEMDG